MQEKERELYFDLLGIGLIMSNCGEIHSKYILGGSFILIIVIKIADALITQYRESRGTVLPSPEVRKPRYQGGDWEEILAWERFLTALIILIGIRYSSAKLYILFLILICAVYLILAVKRFYDNRWYKRSLKIRAYKRKRIRFFGKSALNEWNERNVYLDMFGISTIISIFKPDWIHWIMLGTLVLAVIVRLWEMAMEYYAEVDFERYRERRAKEEEMKRKG